MGYILVILLWFLQSSDKMILILNHIYQKYKNDYTRIISKGENTKKKKRMLIICKYNQDKKKHWDVNELYKEIK